MSGTKALCPAHTKAGKPCGRVAGYGTVHLGWGLCKFHGGSTPNGIKNAHVIAAKEAVVTYGLPIDINPHEALLEEISRTAGHVQWLGTKIAELEPNALVIGLKSVKVEQGVGPRGQVDSKTTETAASISIWLELYHRERRHLVEVCRVALAAGVEERMVRLAERQGERLVAIVEAILVDIVAVLGEAGVAGELVERVRRDAFPLIVRKAIDATTTEGAPAELEVGG